MDRPPASIGRGRRESSPVDRASSYRLFKRNVHLSKRHVSST